MTVETAPLDASETGTLAVFRNVRFLRLWLSQAANQIGGNMVLFGLAGVYVDRFYRRLILMATNVMRGLAFVALYLAGTNLAIILLLNVFVSTVTVFFAPAELAMIPVLVPRSQLLAASGIFTSASEYETISSPRRSTRGSLICAKRSRGRFCW